MNAGASVRIGILLNSFVARCDRSCLCLNATKTKDICIDFRKYPQSQSDTVINDNSAEVVDEYKYLGTTIDNRLKWDRHSIVTYEKNVSKVFTASANTAHLTLIAPLCPCFYKSCIQCFDIFFDVFVWERQSERQE